MDRLKPSIKRKKSTGNGSMIKLKKQPRKFDPMKYLLDERLVAQAIWDCLRDNDPDGVIEILETHLSAKNKSKLAKEHDVPRTTLYHAFKSKNPTLHTLAKLIHAVA